MKVRALAAERGVDPLEVMFETMRDLLDVAAHPDTPEERRLELKERAAQIARMATPYLYPRQRYVEIEEKSPLDVADAILGRMTEDEIFEQLQRRREKRAARVGHAEPEPEPAANGSTKVRN
jgi:chromatin segregation and condensation protein Rec8/ScpA/Scc1 (kleisin family)